MSLVENLSKLLGKIMDISKNNTILNRYAEQLRLGLHSNTDAGPLSGRGNALESEYFHKKNKESLAKLKENQKPPTKATKETPKSTSKK